MTEEINQPQVGEPEQDGEKQPQPDELKQPGEEEKPQAEPEENVPLKERTYSQAEVSKMESAKDREIAAERGARVQVAMQARIAQDRQAEAAAQAKDRNDVDQGLITQAEAQQNYQGRVREAQARMRDEQESPMKEDGARMRTAQDFGGRFDIDPYELLRDQSLRDPVEMYAKAKQISQAKSDAKEKAASDEVEQLKARIKTLEEGEPQFATGLSGTAGPSIDGMSPEEKIAYGLRQKKK